MENGNLEISKLYVESGRAYEVVYNGFVPGALQYIDRDYKFNCVPTAILGQTYIKTAGDDKIIQEKEHCIGFEVNQDVTLYILHADKFVSKPSWLCDFTDTGDKVTRANDPTKKGTFSLFSKKFPKGKIMLGGNVPDGSTGGTGYCMYTVVIVRR